MNVLADHVGLTLHFKLKITCARSGQQWRSGSMSKLANSIRYKFWNYSVYRPISTPMGRTWKIAAHAETVIVPMTVKMRCRLSRCSWSKDWQSMDDLPDIILLAEISSSKPDKHRPLLLEASEWVHIWSQENRRPMAGVEVEVERVGVSKRLDELTLLSYIESDQSLQNCSEEMRQFPAIWWNFKPVCMGLSWLVKPLTDYMWMWFAKVVCYVVVRQMYGFWFEI